MSDKTGIEWTDATWNPVRGCSRVSEGCRHCYAERIAARFVKPGQPFHGFAKNTAPRDALDPVGKRRNGWTGQVALVADKLVEPLRWKAPRRVFVNSMSDLFHKRLSNEEIAAVFGVMAAAPRHTFQVLTKRAERMRDLLSSEAFQRDVEVFKHIALTGRIEERFSATQARNIVTGKQWAPQEKMAWPLSSVWLGVSVEDQKRADERIPLLLETPAAVRFVSAEPLLGPVDIADYLTPPCECDHRTVVHDEACPAGGGRIGWVIAGAESGHGARPAHLDWYRSLRDQCAAAGVSFFLKQHVENGRKVSLPVLDGVQHKEWPHV